MSSSKVGLGDKRLKSLNEILDLQLFTLPHLHLLRSRSAKLLRWHNHIRHDVNDAVLGDTVLDGNAGEGVDLDADEAAVAGDVDGQAAVLEHGGQVDVEVTLGRVMVFRGRLGLVVGVAVESVGWYDVVLEQSLQVLEAVLGEQESINSGAELLEGEV